MQPAGTYSTTYSQELRIIRTRLQWGLLFGFLVILFVVPPVFFSSYALSIFNRICIAIIVVQGLNILTGFCGQISLGQVAFTMVGAYASAILTTRFGFPFPLALLGAGLVAALVGVLFGLPSLRVKGFYLAIATLGAYMVVFWLIQHGGELTKGSTGLYVGMTDIIGFKLNSEPRWFLTIAGVAALMTYFAKNLMRGKIGRAFIAIRDNELAAEVMGINIFAYKLLAFAISSFYAGVAGALLGHYISGLSPDIFTLMDNITYVGMIIVGGMGSVVGAVLGPIMLTGLDQVALFLGPSLVSAFPALRNFSGFASSFGQALVGIVIIVFLLVEPRGLSHRWEMFKRSYRLWPFSD